MSKFWRFANQLETLFSDHNLPFLMEKFHFHYGVGMMKGTVISKCHCGSVELELILPNGFENLRRCNCSICSRRNSEVASVTIDNLKVVKGSAELKQYTFNTHTAKHYFCSICGIYTHHQRRSVPSEYGFNIACVEGIKIEDYLNIEYLDGRDAHPKDTQ